MRKTNDELCSEIKEIGKEIDNIGIEFLTDESCSIYDKMNRAKEIIKLSKKHNNHIKKVNINNKKLLNQKTPNISI